MRAPCGEPILYLIHGAIPEVSDLRLSLVVWDRCPRLRDEAGAEPEEPDSEETLRAARHEFKSSRG